MVDLEKHIRNQREALDSDRPREGHEARFLRKLERQPRRSVKFRHALQIAASIAIILTSTVVLMRHRTGNEVARQEIPATVLEAERYYATQVSYKYDEIRRFDFDNSEEKMVLLDELKELDVYHQQVLSDLEANPGDERVVNALIRHYQLKLDVMDQIILQLNQLKTVTENKNEKKHV